MSRILMGGLIGGLVVFLWSAVSHTVLPLDLADLLHKPGDSYLTAVHPGAAGPDGIQEIRPAGRNPLLVRQLVIELITRILAAAIAAMLLYMAAGSLPAYAARALFVTMLGVFAGVVIDSSYLYGFPAAYAAAVLADQALGWFLGGLAIAAIVRRG